MDDELLDVQGKMGAGDLTYFKDQDRMKLLGVGELFQGALGKILETAGLTPDVVEEFDDEAYGRLLQELAFVVTESLGRVVNETIGGFVDDLMVRVPVEEGKVVVIGIERTEG